MIYKYCRSASTSILQLQYNAITEKTSSCLNKSAHKIENGVFGRGPCSTQHHSLNFEDVRYASVCIHDDV